MALQTRFVELGRRPDRARPRLTPAPDSGCPPAAAPTGSASPTAPFLHGRRRGVGGGEGGGTGGGGQSADEKRGEWAVVDGPMRREFGLYRFTPRPPFPWIVKGIRQADCKGNAEGGL